MTKLKIYWNTHKLEPYNEVIIVEPSGKIHNSDKNIKDNESILDISFMVKYINRFIEYYFNGKLQTENYLSDVGKDSNGRWYFKTIKSKINFAEFPFEKYEDLEGDK